MDDRYREIIKEYSGSIEFSKIEKSVRESKLFTSRMLQDITDETSFFELLPTRGPDAFYRFIALLKANKYTDIAEGMCHLALPIYHISDNHGYCFISWNTDFTKIKNSDESGKLSDRYCTEAASLDSALITVGYSDTDSECVELPSDDLYSKLKTFCEKDFSKVKSCIIIILSYGIKYNNSRLIYTNDGKYIPLHRILNLFSDKNCLKLKFKPKIFLLPSFDISDVNVEMEEVELSPDVNDTFIWCFPSTKLSDSNKKYFEDLLSKNLKEINHEFDFEEFLKSSYCEFIKQFENEELNYIPKFERLGHCKEKIMIKVKS